jgi:hypothetical protein
VGCWCGACGGKTRGRRLSEMVAHVEVVPGQRRRRWLDGRWFPDLTVAEWGGVMERRQTAKEMMKFCQVTLGQKAGPQFIGSSISSGSTWNRC